ncbi:hypothetical protein GCM10027431_07980 [Lysobacter rhizosphaerae]
MRETRKYLAIFWVPRTQAEHSSIAKAVAHHSDGDYQMVFMQAGAKPDIPFVVAYIFTSGTEANQMGFGLLNGDNYLVTEIGDRNWVNGSVRAQEWLQKHRPEGSR